MVLDERRIEAVLATRVDRLALVLDQVTDNKNWLSCLRTCDVLGVQRVFLIGGGGGPAGAAAAAAGVAGLALGGEQDSGGGPQAQARPVELGRKKGRVARASSSWLDVVHFAAPEQAAAALKAEGWTLWATDLAPGAVPLERACAGEQQLPQRLALVVGSEAAGISGAMRAAADARVFLPQFGFTQSYNVGVAAALALQQLLLSPQGQALRGDLLGGERRAEELRLKWRAAVARGPECVAGKAPPQQQPQQQRNASSSAI